MSTRMIYKLSVVLVIAFASCTEKQYTCQCMGGIAGGTAEVQITARNRVSAKNLCNNYSNPPGTPDGQSCNIKD